jgi:hypothetical protein
MIAGKSLNCARAAYHCLNTLSNNDMLDNINKNDPRPLTDRLVALVSIMVKALFNIKARFKHMISHKVSSNTIYIPYCTQTVIIMCFNSEQTTDLRVLNEIGVLSEYQKTFYKDINSKKLLLILR